MTISLEDTIRLELYYELGLTITLLFIYFLPVLEFQQNQIKFHKNCKNIISINY
jgi:hypothetical protein